MLVTEYLKFAQRRSSVQVCDKAVVLKVGTPEQIVTVNKKAGDVLQLLFHYAKCVKQTLTAGQVSSVLA